MFSVVNLKIHLDKGHAGSERLIFRNTNDAVLSTSVQLQHNVNFCFEEKKLKAKVIKHEYVFVCKLLDCKPNKVYCFVMR